MRPWSDNSPNWEAADPADTGQTGQVQLPVMPPVAPMLSKSVREIPPGMSYEPKWDGFRTICFRDGDDVEFGSRNERPMTRYFPELVAAAKAELSQRCVIDGEIVIATGHGLDFQALQLRLHPAASRVRMLAEQTPASFVAFDLLALGDEDYTTRPFSERRAALVDALGVAGGSIHLTPATTDTTTAQRRIDEIEGGSLLLGLYQDDGTLASVGVIGAFPMAKRRQLFTELQPLVTGFDDHPWDWAAQMVGDNPRKYEGGSRWNAGKDLSFVPLRPERVVEVRYDHIEGRRFRHTAQFNRWRPDRDPQSCTYAQLEQPVSSRLNDVVPGLIQR